MVAGAAGRVTMGNRRAAAGGPPGRALGCPRAIPPTREEASHDPQTPAATGRRGGVRVSGARRWCPECGAGYPAEIVACKRCLAVLVDEPPIERDEPVVVHRVPDAAAGALLCGMLEHHGVATVLRSATLPGYGVIRRDWSTTAWGEILVPAAAAAEARALIAEYLAALESGGLVRDEDVEAP